MKKKLQVIWAIVSVLRNFLMTEALTGVMIQMENHIIQLKQTVLVFAAALL